MQTTTHGYPYPENTDPVASYPGIVQQLAQLLNTRFPLPLPKYVTSDLTVDAGTTFKSKAVNFGTTYSAPPVVVAQVSNTNANAGYYASVYGVTASGCTIRVDKAIGAAPGSAAPIRVGLVIAPSGGVI